MITVTMPQSEYDDNLRKAEIKGSLQVVELHQIRLITLVDKILQGRPSDIPEHYPSEVKILLRRLVAEGARWPK